MDEYDEVTATGSSSDSSSSSSRRHSRERGTASCHHVPTREAAREADATGAELVGGLAAATKSATMTFGDYFELPIEVGLKIIAACSRAELGTVAIVCRDWQVLSLIERSAAPASAKDIAVKVRLLQQGHHRVDEPDGEYHIWRDGDRALPPMRLYCHNVLTDRPTEFVTLPAAAAAAVSNGGDGGGNGGDGGEGKGEGGGGGGGNN